MRLSIFISFLLALALAGCVSKAKARADAQAAFAAGEKAAFARIQQARGPTVTLAGQVRNPFVPFTPGLTLARAIVAAQYYGASDPVSIVIIRNGEEIPVPPGKLLEGEDVPLQAGDIVKVD